MTKPKYLPHTYEGKLIHLVEECAEVQKAVTKIQRFGLENYNPDTKIQNSDKLFQEMKDLELTWKRLKKDIQKKLRGEFVR